MTQDLQSALDDRALARLADMLAPRIAEELSARTAVGPELVDAAAIARRFALSAEWVRDHADELGAIRLGEGKRPRLRFDPAEVLCALRRRSRRVGSPVADLPTPAEDSPRAGRGRVDNGLDALPVRRLQPAPTTQSGARGVATPGRPATKGQPSPRRKTTRVARAPTVGSRASRRLDREESK
jgi:hypothetical protein